MNKTVIKLCAVFLLGFLNSAYACSCSSLSLEEDVNRNLFVFSGQVVKITEEKNDLHVCFAIDQMWKGPEWITLVEMECLNVKTNSSSAACGYPFEKEGKYFVFADKAGRVSLCSHTKLLSEASEDLQALEKLIPQGMLLIKTP